MGDLSPAARVIACLEQHAVDGVAVVGTNVIKEETGIFRRCVQITLRQMVQIGALELLQEARTFANSPNSYRLVKPELISREPILRMWSDERTALLVRDYPTHAIDRLLAPLNELAGPAVTVLAVRNKVAELGLKHVTGFWAGALALNRMKRPKKVKAAPVPKEQKPKVKAVPRVIAEPKTILPDPLPRHVSGLRFASSVTSRLPRIDWKALPKLAPRDGCRWPLTCGEPAVGAFCDAHRGMLR